MDSKTQKPSGEAGYALLQGPTWSIVLKNTRTTLGRSSQSNQPSHTTGKSQSLNHSSKTLIISPKKIKNTNSRRHSPNSASLESLEKIKRTSPLYWRLVWADINSSSNSSQSAPRSRASPSLNDNHMDITTERSESNGLNSQPSTKNILQSSTTSSMLESTSSDSHSLSSHVNTPCDIDLGPDPLISRHHATISFDPVICVWEAKCHSKNGMWVNGRMIYHLDSPAMLGNNSRIQIGSVAFIFLLPLHPATSSNETPFVTSTKTLDGLVADASAFQSSKTEIKQNPKKRRYTRAIAPITAIAMKDDYISSKRSCYGSHVSQRTNSVRQMLFGENYQSEALAYLRDELEEGETFDVVAPHLKTTFSPNLNTEGIGSSDAFYQSEMTTQNQAREGAKRKKIIPKAANGEEPEVAERPKITYTQLIRQALESHPEKRMLYSELTEWVAKTYPYYQTAAAGNWTATLRHGLGHGEEVIRQKRGKGQGKGGFYALAAWYDGDTLLAKPKMY